MRSRKQADDATKHCAFLRFLYILLYIHARIESYRVVSYCWTVPPQRVKNRQREKHLRQLIHGRQWNRRDKQQVRFARHLRCRKLPALHVYSESHPHYLLLFINNAKSSCRNCALFLRLAPDLSVMGRRETWFPTGGIFVIFVVASELRLFVAVFLLSCSGSIEVTDWLLQGRACVTISHAMFRNDFSRFWFINYLGVIAGVDFAWQKLEWRTNYFFSLVDDEFGEKYSCVTNKRMTSKKSCVGWYFCWFWLFPVWRVFLQLFIWWSVLYNFLSIVIFCEECLEGIRKVIFLLFFKNRTAKIIGFSFSRQWIQKYINSTVQMY